MLYAKELEMILMTETWLNENFTDNEVLQSGFEISGKDRPVDQCRGGVLIAIRNSMPYKRIFIVVRMSRKVLKSLQLRFK